MPPCHFEQVVGGHRNTVLRATCLDGVFAFKTTRRSEAQLAWLGHVGRAATAAGLAVALPCQTRTGLWAQDGWTLEPWIEGRRATKADATQLVPLIARFHQEAATVPQRPGFASTRQLCQTDAAGDVDLSTLPRELAARCRDAWVRVPHTPQCLIHGDLNLSNSLVTPSGQFALIDWDEARVDHPGFDMWALGQTVSPAVSQAADAYEIACCWSMEPQRARRLARHWLAKDLAAKAKYDP